MCNLFFLITYQSFNIGTLEQAEAKLVQYLIELGKPLLDSFLAQTQQTVAHLKLDS